MEPLLKTLSIIMGLLGSDPPPAAAIDAWPDYVWRVRAADRCIRIDSRGFCDIVDDKWDWKREQHYSFSFLKEAASNSLTVHLRLDNRDPSDDDNVCVVALFTNSRGEPVAVFYRNWFAEHGRPIEADIALHPSLPIGSIASVAVGSKQCDAPSPDDAEFEHARLQLNQR